MSSSFRATGEGLYLYLGGCSTFLGLQPENAGLCLTTADLCFGGMPPPPNSDEAEKTA